MLKTHKKPDLDAATEKTLSELKKTAGSVVERRVRDAILQSATFLSLREMELTDASLRLLLRILPETLTILDVRKNKIGVEGAKDLAGNETLTTLDVSGNNIGDTGAKALAGHTTLTTLDVSRNKIGNEGAIALALNTKLTRLKFIGNDDISPKIQEVLNEQNPLKRRELARAAGVSLDAYRGKFFRSPGHTDGTEKETAVGLINSKLKTDKDESTLESKKSFS